MGKVSELPILERPREKALYYGIDKLSDYELIALLIGSGCRDHSAMDIAYNMLSDNNGLNNLVRKPFSDLLNYKGMGKSKAIKIEAAFEIAKRFQSLKIDDDEKVVDADDVYSFMISKLLLTSTSFQEQMYLVVLDKKQRILHFANIYKGNENSIICSTKQIIQQVILHNGHFFYIIHNHPSGILEPSQDDIFFTMNLISDVKKLDIVMLDHLIVSDKGYYSFSTHSIHLNN